MGHTFYLGTTTTTVFCGVLPTTTVPAGRGVVACTTTGYGLKASLWTHLGCVYDNGVFTLYRDGRAVYSGAGWEASDLRSTIPTCSGTLNTPTDPTINYGVSAASGGGTWFVGSTGSGTGMATIELDEVRVADVARPASWFAAMVAAGPYRLNK